MDAALHVALLWHQHQPLYKDLGHPTAAGSYPQPWVRLHAIRDYYGKAELAAEHPGLRLTINLTPVLLWQLDDYTARGATDRALELTRTPAEALTPDEREAVLGSFFDAHWEHQILPHPRYAELFAQRREGRPFAAQDVRDLQMWFNLAWFGREFRDGEVPLVTGEVASVRRFVAQGRGFTTDDIAAMLEAQYAVMRAVVPLHRALQDAGRIEVSTTPFFHPILPLLIDTDQATIDRPGATHPTRFARPEDAEAQVRLAVEDYTHRFGRPPCGMWPAEGAVSQAVVPLLARYGLRWMATDAGVLARSGRWGYHADDPDVLCQPYRAEDGAHAVGVFFRDTGLSNQIGFHLQDYADAAEAARAFVRELRARFADRLTGAEDRVLTVVLDGENAWSAYADDGRPFLHALYAALTGDAGLCTVTFAEYLAGDPARGVRAHPVDGLRRVYDLFTGSWVDEMGSAPGVDLGTWIGEGEENRAWELLRMTRDDVERAGATAERAPEAFHALYAAEGSDWFWWFGDDQDSTADDRFDDLFRGHLRHVYRALGRPAPAALDEHIVPRTVIWAFTQPVPRIQPGDVLAVRTHCAGVLTWRADGGAPQEVAVAPAGGVMAGIGAYYGRLGPFDASTARVHFRFRCGRPDCDGSAACCCRPEEQTVEIARTPAG